MTSDIRWILFDLGGVLVDFSGVRRIRDLFDHAVDDDELFALWRSSKSVHSFETGRMPPDEFLARLVSEWRMNADAQRLEAVFTQFVQGYLPGAESLLDELSGRFRLACLSNSNPLHWRRAETLGLLEPFEQAMSSHHLGTMKPDPSAFERALERLGCEASQVVFLDDVRENTESAASFGITACRVRGPAEARQSLAALGILSRTRDGD